MIEIKGEYCLKRLTLFREVIDKIVSIFNLPDYNFELKLILTEALNNAYIHGNLRNETKSIFLRYFYDGKKIKLEVEDSGKGFENTILKKEIADENLLNESGRGLFIIYNLVDKFEIKNSILMLEKSIF